MARYRAGYGDDYGLRDFDSRRPRRDVGSRGYDRGYFRGERGGAYERPWVGGYREGYQGGSGGIGVNTSGTGGAWIRGEGGAGRGRYDRGDQGYAGGGGEYSGRYVRGARGGYDRGYGRGYDGGGLNRWRRWF